jgi:hypothetical protein
MYGFKNGLVMGFVYGLAYMLAEAGDIPGAPPIPAIPN